MTRHKLKSDPTRTRALRERYQRALRLAWNRVIEQLRGDDTISLSEVEPLFPQELASVMTPTHNQYVTAAFRSGVNRGNRQLRRVRSANVGVEPGVNVDMNPSPGVESPISPVGTGEPLILLPGYRRSVNELIGGAADELTGIIEDTRGGVEEKTNRSDGRVSTDVVLTAIIAVALWRSDALANTEIIRAFTDGLLFEYLRFGVESVRPRAEFTTARDSEVCPKCRLIDGTEYTLDEIESATFEFDGVTYPVKPPVHPHCRCLLVPV